MRNAKLWCGAKNNEAPRSFEYMVFTKDGNPVNPLNLQNPLNLFRTQSRGGRHAPRANPDHQSLETPNP